MAIPFEDILAKLPDDERREIEKEGRRLAAEYLTLRELRKARRLSQKAVAEKLKTNQAGVSKIEKRADLMLSTLRGYIEAAGGSLELVARFPDAPPVRIDQMRDLGKAGKDAPDDTGRAAA
ncbi:MAG: XRE family transcriptional regulator [Sphingobium sp.]